MTELSPMFEDERSKYHPTKMEEYNGPDIDWHGYNLQFMSAQLSKTMYFSNEALKGVNAKLESLDKKVSSPNNHKKQTK